MSHGFDEDRESSNMNKIFQQKSPTSKNGNDKTVRQFDNSKQGSNVSNDVEGLKDDFDDLIMKEKPEVSWNEVIGLEDAKRAIRESIVYPTKRIDLFPLGWPRGILLYGPPGCGKTLLAAMLPGRSRRLFCQC